VAERAVVKTRRIESIDQFLALAAELFDVGEVEYVSTQEYRKK